MARLVNAAKVRRDGVSTAMRVKQLEYWCAKVSGHWLTVAAETENTDEAQWAFQRAARYEHHLRRVEEIGGLR